MRDAEGHVRCAADDDDDGPALRIDGGRTVAEVAGGAERLVLRYDDGAVACVGACAVPDFDAAGAGAAMVGGARQVAAGGHDVCTVDAAGVARCFGTGFQWVRSAPEAHRQGVYRVEGSGAVRAVFPGDRPCFVFADGAAGCGVAPGPDGVARVEADPSLAGFVSAWQYGDSLCGLRGDGTVACRGANHDGQLGDGTTDARRELRAVPGLDAVTTLVGGPRFYCGLRRDGTVWCWGLAASGRLGDEAVGRDDCGGGRDVRPCRRRPSRVAGPARVWALAAEGDAVCALTADDTVWCWGADRAPHRVSFERSPPACLPASLRAEGHPVGVAVDATDRAARYCVCATTESMVGHGCRCLRADLDTGDLRAETPVRVPEPFRAIDPYVAPTGPAGPWEVQAVPEGLRVCRVGGEACRTMPAPAGGFGEAPQVDDTGAYVVTVRRPPDDAAQTANTAAQHRVEVYAVATGRRVATVAHHGVYGPEMGRVWLTGRVGVALQCAAGPACLGLRFDLATGRRLPDLDVAYYTARPERLPDGRWVWLDATRGRAVYVDAGGRVQGPTLTWPVQGGVEGEAVVRTLGTTTVIVYDGDGGQHAAGGTVVQVDLPARRVLRTIVPEVCPGGPRVTGTRGGSPRARRVCYDAPALWSGQRRGGRGAAQSDTEWTKGRAQEDRR